MDERPGFFKVFIPELCSQKMKIPPAFAANYMRRRRIKNAILLRDRQGNAWPVEIIVEGRDFFFEKGWVQFVEDNQIDVGDFLVFKLGGDLFFNFKHFGRSACEKEKCCSFRFAVKQREEEEEEDNEEEIDLYDEGEDEENVDNEDDKGVEKNSVVHEEEDDDDGEEYVDDENEVEEDDDDDDDDDDEEYADDENEVEDDDDDDDENAKDDGEYEENKEADEDVEVVELEDNEKKDEENKRTESKCVSKKRKTYTPRITREDIKKIKEEIFSSGVPIPQNPYFVLKIRPQNRRELFIPVDVLRYHGLELTSELKIVNEMGKGNMSKVKVWRSGRVALKGWSTFCDFNHLKMDDKCLLEFVPDRKNKTQLCLQVLIFPA